MWLYFYVLQIKFESCHVLCVNVWRSYASFWTNNIGNMQFSVFSPTCFEIFSWNCTYYFIFMYYRSSYKAVSLCQFLKQLYLVLNLQCSSLFSYMFWNIELKCCICFCFNVLHIKLECRHSASVRLSVRPFSVLFPPTCFDKLSWNFKIDFQLFC